VKNEAGRRLGFLQHGLADGFAAGNDGCWSAVVP
jgi:hypothetical protein